MIQTNNVKNINDRYLQNFFSIASNIRKKNLHWKYAFDINKYFIFRKTNEIPNYDRRERNNIVKKSK